MRPSFVDGRLKLIVKRHDIKFDEWGIKKGMLCKQRETNGYDNNSNMIFWGCTNFTLHENIS